MRFRKLGNLRHNHEFASGKHSRDQAQPGSTRFVMLREAKHPTISREITRIMMSVILAK
jgi:hypothetical protein